MMIINISLSAVPLSLYRPLVRGWNKTRYADLFNKYEHDRNAYRIYLPLTGSTNHNKVIVPESIVSAVQSQGYYIDNYIAGIAIKNEDSKRVVKIGKLLKEKSVKRVYDTDPQRSATKQEKAWVVISRHPYDIAGMSFDRGWNSCMNVKGGTYKEHLKADIKYGTLVAYYVKDTDKNINNPIARILIKPYINVRDVVLLLPESQKTYGTAPASFFDTVSKFCLDVNAGLPKGEYKLAMGLYADAESTTRLNYDEDDYAKILADEFLLDSYLQQPVNIKFLRLVIKSEHWESSYIRKFVMESNSVDTHILKLGITDSRSDVRCAAATSLKATPEILKIGCKDADDAVVLAVASNRRTPSEALIECMKNNDSGIREKVVNNCNVTEYILEIGATDKKTFVRKLVMLSVKSTPRILRIGIDDVDSSVVAAALQNANVTEALLLIGAKSKNKIERQFTMHSTQATEAVLIIGVRDTEAQVRRAAARSVKATPKTLRISAADDDDQVREFAMLNANVTPEILMLCVNDRYDDVKVAVFKSDKATTEILMIGASDADRHTRMTAIKNNNATRKVLLLCVNDVDLCIKQEVTERLKNYN
jgi:hypothetical protein